MKQMFNWLMIVCLLVGLAGCGESPFTKVNDVTTASTHGLTVHFTTQGVNCIFVKDGYGGGLSCNWEKYNKEKGY